MEEQTDVGIVKVLVEMVEALRNVPVRRIIQNEAGWSSTTTLEIVR